MRRFITLFVTTAFLLFPLCVYMYGRGEADGITRYRHSKEFMLTVYIMYMHGVVDGCKDKSLCH